MIDQTPIARKAFLTLSIIAILSFGNKLVAQNGKQIFLDNCARCHSMTARLTGPASRWPEAKAETPPVGLWRPHGRGALLLPQAAGTDGMYLLLLRRT